MAMEGTEFEGCGREGPIRGMFLAEFHPIVGPRIRLQTDSELLTPELFNDFSDFIIPKQRLSQRNVTANALDFKVVGYPVVLDNDKYKRNQFIFNVCFVCHPWSKTVQYEPAVEKLSRYLIQLEKEKEFLSKDTEENNNALLEAMRDALAQLNSDKKYAKISLGDYDVHLVVIRVLDGPLPVVHEYDVPVILGSGVLDKDNCDLTTRQVI